MHSTKLIQMLICVIAGTHTAAAQDVGQGQSADELAVNTARETPGYQNLRKIGLAFHGYHDIFERFPPAVVYGPDGRTTHSWRVEILPVLKHYVEKIEPEKLHARINRQQYDGLIEACGYNVNVAWDDPQNQEALLAIPDVFRHPADAPGSNESAWYAVVGPGTAFEPSLLVAYDDIRTWPASTLMIVESRSREPWTRPLDIAYDPTATVPRFGGFSDGGFLSLTCDGAVHFVGESVEPADLRAFLSRDPKDLLTIPGVPYRYD